MLTAEQGQEDAITKWLIANTIISMFKGGATFCSQQDTMEAQLQSTPILETQRFNIINFIKE